MKHLFTLFVAAGMLTSLIHCTGDDTAVTPTADSGTGNDAQVAADSKVAPDSGADATGNPAPATLSAALARGKLRGKIVRTHDTGLSVFAFSGTSVGFEIPSAAIVDKSVGPFSIDTDEDGVADANAVTGNVDIEISELASVSDMIRNGHPTLTNKGEWLESGGAFEVHVKQGGKELTILKIDTIKFIPSKRVAAAGEAMQLFLDSPLPAGADPLWKIPVAPPPAAAPQCTTADVCRQDKACSNQVSCRAFLCPNGACKLDICVGTAACPLKPECAAAGACSDVPACKDSPDCRVKCKGRCDTDECKDVQPTCKPFPVLAQSSGGNYLFNSSPFGNIGSHNSANCDRITNLSAAHATTFVRFTSNYATESGVFFIPTVANSAIKLYTRISGAPVGQEGFKSYDNAMPVGIAGKLVVVAVNNGKYYYQEKPYTIVDAGNPAAGQDTILVAPVEVTEADFNARIDAL